MADEEEVIVKIDDELDQDAQKQEGGAAGAQPSGDDAARDLAAQYKELEARDEQRKREIEEANRRRLAAEHAAAEARREAESARTQVASSNLETINTALASANAEVEAAKKDIRNAGESGDYAALADAQERLAAAKALALRYDEAKSDLEAQSTRRPAQKAEDRAQPSRAADPVEAYIAGRTERTASWLREHTDYIVDPRKNAKLTGAHYDAIAEGLTPDTDAYFEHVEKFLRIKPVEDVVKKEEQPQAIQPKRAVPPRAPVNAAASSSANGDGGGGAIVKLSPGEARAATDGTHVWNYDDQSGQKRFRKGDPIGVQEFARRKREMMKAGVYDRTYDTQ